MTDVNQTEDVKSTTTYEVTLTDKVDVPTEYQPKLTTPLVPEGEGKVIGWALPDGKIIRPVIGYEISDLKEDDYQDMSYQQLCDLGILSGDDLSVTIHDID